MHCDTSFECMGSHARIMVEGAHAEREVERARAWLLDFDRRLTRFRPHSELSTLNTDPADAPHASRLLRSAVGAALWAARRSGGLVDPTLASHLVRAGYTRSRAHARPAPIELALAAAPPRQAARPDPAARWRLVTVEERAGRIRRPAGLAIDLGGSGKGFAADTVARSLAGFPSFVVDLGGDLRLGGTGAAEREPFEVEVEHPITRERGHLLRLRGGAVATSGVGRRVWERPGGYAHHLLDPATGEPAWTGLVSVTALAESALEAETLAKAALLSGPEGARKLLARKGGLLVHDDGEVEPSGPLAARPRVRVRLPAPARAA